MDIEIAGVSLYYIISWFFVYSFLGWLWETEGLLTVLYVPFMVWVL